MSSKDAKKRIKKNPSCSAVNTPLTRNRLKGYGRNLPAAMLATLSYHADKILKLRIVDLLLASG